MNQKRQKARYISLNANINELKMLSFIMEKDCRNSFADCLRNLIKQRFFFLNQNTNISVNDQNTVSHAPATEISMKIAEEMDDQAKGKTVEKC